MTMKIPDCKAFSPEFRRCIKHHNSKVLCSVCASFSQQDASMNYVTISNTHVPSQSLVFIVHCSLVLNFHLRHLRHDVQKRNCVCRHVSSKIQNMHIFSSSLLHLHTYTQLNSCCIFKLHNLCSSRESTYLLGKHGRRHNVFCYSAISTNICHSLECFCIRRKSKGFVVD